jgi:hypothetical protein
MAAAAFTLSSARLLTTTKYATRAEFGPNHCSFCQCGVNPCHHLSARRNQVDVYSI